MSNSERQKLHQKGSANSLTLRRSKDRLMNDKKQEPQVSGNDPAQLPAGTKRAEKVRSSRFEWETKSETDSGYGKSTARQRSLLVSLAGRLAKLFFGSRDFFDKDDDATPSAA